MGFLYTKKIGPFKNCVNMCSLYFIMKYNINYVKYQYNASKDLDYFTFVYIIQSVILSLSRFVYFHMLLEIVGDIFYIH